MKPAGSVRLHVEPITLAAANEYVALIHRHHGPVVTMGSASFSIAACAEDGEIRGIATAGLPIAANRLRDGWRTCEVMRVATDGTPNACSILYAACARAAKALGYSRIITYVLSRETGASVKAAGWEQDEGVFGDLSWQNRPDRSGSNTGPKGRWSLSLAGLERPPLRLPGWVEDLRPADPALSLFDAESAR